MHQASPRVRVRRRGSRSRRRRSRPWPIFRHLRTTRKPCPSRMTCATSEDVECRLSGRRSSGKDTNGAGSTCASSIGSRFGTTLLNGQFTRSAHIARRASAASGRRRSSYGAYEIYRPASVVVKECKNRIRARAIVSVAAISRRGYVGGRLRCLARAAGAHRRVDLRPQPRRRGCSAPADRMVAGRSKGAPADQLAAQPDLRGASSPAAAPRAPPPLGRIAASPARPVLLDGDRAGVEVDRDERRYRRRSDRATPCPTSCRARFRGRSVCKNSTARRFAPDPDAVTFMPMGATFYHLIEGDVRSEQPGALAAIAGRRRRAR